jgi:hypothetical protein
VLIRNRINPKDDEKGKTFPPHDGNCSTENHSMSCYFIGLRNISSSLLKLVDMDSGVPKEFAYGTSAAHGFVLFFPASTNGEVPNELRGSLSVAFTLGATQLVIIITEMRNVSVSDEFCVLFFLRWH